MESVKTAQLIPQLPRMLVIDLIQSFHFSGKILFALFILVTLNSCETITNSLTATKELYLGPNWEEAEWDIESEAHRDLKSLPKPKGRIITSAYGFRDQTGQYKPSPSNSFSTAVSQGANSILIKALRDSGWFIAIEREGLQNLLTERKIIRAAQKQKGKKKIPPLLGANILLEGGIIGYDTNIETGGIGAKYFGIGPSERYMVDQVTVSLRAIDIYSGKIVNDVVVRKSVLSKQINAGVFRFVKFKRLLEAEAGYTRNEPIQLALVDAIETAVVNLISTGIKLKLWTLNDKADINHPVIQRHLGIKPPEKNATKEKSSTTSTDVTKSRQGHKPGTTHIPSQAKEQAEEKPPPEEPTNAAANTSVIPIEVAPKIAVAPPGDEQKEKKEPQTSPPPPKPTVQMAEKPPVKSTPAPEKKVVKPPLPAKKPKKTRRPIAELNDHGEVTPTYVYNVSPSDIDAERVYSIQLMSSTDILDLVDFVSDVNVDRNDISYINYEIDGEGRYALLYGSFRAKEKAIKAINTLPENLKIYRPWVRPVNQ